MRSEVKWNTFVKSHWKSLVRPNCKSETLHAVINGPERDRYPSSSSGGLVDLSDPWIPTFGNCRDASRSTELPPAEADLDPLGRETSSSSDSLGVLLNRWIYADASALPPPPVPDKILLDIETCRTLGPPRVNDKDPQAYSPDSGYCSYDSTPSAAQPLSYHVTSPPDCEHHSPIDNVDVRLDKTNFQDRSNLGEIESEGCQPFSSDLEIESAESPNAELLASPLSIRSRPVSALQSVVGSQSASSGTGSSSIDDVDEDFMRAVLNHQLLRRLMEEFYSLLDSILKASPHGSSTNSSGRASELGTTSSSFTAGSFLSTNKSLGNGKGRANGSDYPDDDQDQDGTRKRSRTRQSGRLYACPFYKYDARKYCCSIESRSRFRNCAAGPGWDSISRLRQHLRRVHSPPLQCRRCWEVFPDDPAMEAHARSAYPCQLLEREIVEGISQAKFELLNRRGVDWNEMYRIIFPGAPLPASSYHETFEPPVNSIQSQSTSSMDLSAYESYARTELPRLVEAMLESMIQAEATPLEEKLKPLLVDVVRNCQSILSHRWQTRNTSASPSPPTQGSSQEYFNPIAEPELSFGGPYPQNLMHQPTVVQSAYQEPPFWNDDGAMTGFEAFDATQMQPLPSIAEHSSESGYAGQSQSSNSEYFCRCYQSVNYGQHGNQYPASSDQMPQVSKFSSFTTFRPSLVDLQEKRVIQCNMCGGWQFT